VSSHFGARVTANEDFTNHYWWQGKFYSKSGKDQRFPPFSVCGFGHVQGIHGANCRHHKGPGDGEHNPFREYDSEENKKEYELQQKQRAKERRIRKTEQQCVTLKKAMDSAETEESKILLEEQYQKKAALLGRQNEDYNDFCEENNLKRRSERLQIAKWDREQARASIKAAKDFGNDFTTKENSGTIKMVSGARITDQFGKPATQHAERYYGLVRSMKTDVSRIAENTGFSVEEIQKVKDYVFINEHDLGEDTPRRFDPSFAMAQSWQRLIDGNPEPHDMTLIKHEVMERNLVEDGMSQEEAHILTSEKYNYTRESDAYYAALKEHKNRKRDG
jgi:hypothetical protein